jgi:hypothetical protein
LTLEQQPSSSPQVAYQDGKLTIIAQNSTLGDVLRAVRTRTGATVDVPPNATERVVGHLGPGPAREVLASLLNGSHFDYVLLGSATNPNALDRVILMAKSGDVNQPAQPAANEAAVQPQGQPQNPPPGAEGEEVSNDEFNADDATDAEQQPDQQAEEQQQQQSMSPINGQPGVKTPEQLLQELQRQQQIQQQQQQGTPPQYPPGAPQGFPVPPGQQLPAPPQ